MSYEEAIHLLNSRKTAAKPDLNDMHGSDDMMKWLEIMGHTSDALDELNLIHVAGTNGKGSTCGMIDHLLRLYGGQSDPPLRTVLYSSPHLRSIRERIKINGIPIDKDQFTSYFFEIWEKLPKAPTSSLDIPRYLQLLALLAFHVCIREHVDVFVCEAHMGGEFDATNVVKNPALTVVTTIAEDHVQHLGPTLVNIAKHKAGIFKQNRPALSTTQCHEVQKVLRSTANMKHVNLTFVEGIHSVLDEIQGELAEPQKQNYSLAIEAVSSFFQQDTIRGPAKFDWRTLKLGIETFRIDGRFQALTKAGQRWYIDGAHNEQGIQAATTWFLRASEPALELPCVLVFSQYSSRNVLQMLRSIFSIVSLAGRRLDRVIFSSYTERDNGENPADRNAAHKFSAQKQSEYVELWRRMDGKADIQCTRTIESALRSARTSTTTTHIFVTGSLLLAGSALRLLDDI